MLNLLCLNGSPNRKSFSSSPNAHPTERRRLGLCFAVILLRIDRSSLRCSATEGSFPACRNPMCRCDVLITRQRKYHANLNALKFLALLGAEKDDCHSDNCQNRGDQ